MEQEQKNGIMARTYAELFDNVKRASTAEAKVDMLIDFFWKVVMNDMHCLEEADRAFDKRLDQLEKKIDKAIVIIGAMIFAIELFSKIGPTILKLIRGW